MNYRTKGKNWAGMLAVGALALGGTLAAPQQAQAQAMKIGVVDENKVGEGYIKLKNTLAKYDQRAQTLQPQLAARAWLSEQDGLRFDQIIMKDAPSAAEQAEMAGLVTKGTNAQNDYTKLIGQQTRSDADNNSLKALQALGQGAQVGAQRIEDALLDKVKTQQKDEVDKLVDAADAVIRDLAQKNGFTLVLRKDAVVFNQPTIDITADVLKQLNK